MQPTEGETLYTTLRVSDAGVVLYTAHHLRLSGAGARARNEFDAWCRTAKPGVYNVWANAEGIRVEERGPSTLQDGLPVRLVVSPLAGEAEGPFEKIPPPSPYDGLRQPGVATLVTSADGAELYEGASAALVGWDGRQYVCAPLRRPRILSTSESELRRAMLFTEKPLTKDERLPLILLNAVKGPCRIDYPGRDPFPEDRYRELAALIEATARR